MSDQPTSLTLYRRRSIQLMALVAAWAVTAFAPICLLLPIVTGGWRTNKFGMAMAVFAAAFLGAAGAYLLHAAKPDWLNLTLDSEGFTLTRGSRRHRREWSDVTGVQLTRRQTGRTTIPTIGVTFQDRSVLYLDDIYTMMPEDLVRALRQHCGDAGNPWPSVPSIEAKNAKRATSMKWLLLLPGMLCVMAVIALVKVKVAHH